MSQNLNAPKTGANINSPLPIPPTPVDDGALAEVPPHKWAVWLAQDVVLYSRERRPNLVRRFFLWAFFGWRWVPLKRNGRGPIKEGKTRGNIKKIQSDSRPTKPPPGARAVSQDSK